MTILLGPGGKVDSNVWEPWLYVWDAPCSELSCTVKIQNYPGGCKKKKKKAYK